MNEDENNQIPEEQNVNSVEPEVQPNYNAEPVERKGFNITSMILGIIGIVFMCISGYVSLPASIIAIIFSIAGRKEAGRGMGIAGMVLGIVTLVLYVICVVFFAGIIGIAALSDMSV